ncbi:hypothetical protein EVAR_93783_1 [Eumeta japonica]|uniref:Uncharacterized protein n=1 Tax=Eumeta variegata TaxID=151549 RepID=A0A4C1VC33_EUMVA|nr:hypothetical protein EVAR_93783_1 [Eumeta japonica]
MSGSTEIRYTLKFYYTKEEKMRHKPWKKNCDVYGPNAVSTDRSKNVRKRSWSKDKQAPQTIAKPATSYAICMVEYGLEEHYSLGAFAAGQSHQFGFLQSKADETQERSRKKTSRN